MADKKISQLSGASTPLAGTEVLPIVQSGSTVKVASNDLTVKNIRSNATTGILQIAGPAAASTRTMTVPDANFTAARTDAAQTFSGTQTFSGANTYNVITNSVTGSNVSPSFAGTQFLGFADALKAQADGGDCSNSSFRGVYRIQTCDDGSQNMVTRMQFNGNADCTLSTVNLVIGTAGKGIDFSANTGAAGETSALLNWYEEGTWTPVLSDGTNNATSTVNTSGHYVRVGRTVTVWCRVQISSLGSVSGAVRVTGLPFTAQNVQSNYGGISFGLAAGMAISANQVPSGIFIPNDTYVALYLWDATTGSTTLQATELTANADLYFSGSYQAA